VEHSTDRGRQCSRGGAVLRRAVSSASTISPR